MIHTCPHCGRKFDWRVDLARHLEGRRKRGDDQCPGTRVERKDKATKSAYRLDHQRATHNDPRGWTYADDTDDWS